ncbi:response regulator [Pseudomonas piscis]
MKYSNPFPARLLRYQARLSLGLLILLGLGLLCTTLYWAAIRLVEQQSVTLKAHFSQLMDSVQEQELFLGRVPTIAPVSSYPSSIHLPLRQRTVPPFLAQGNCDDRNLPHTLAQALNRHLSSREFSRLLVAGMQLLTLYRAFWPDSHLQAPRVLVLNACDGLDLDTLGARTGYDDRTRRDNSLSVQELRQVLQKHWRFAVDQVHWQQYPRPHPVDSGRRLLARISLYLAPAQLQVARDGGWMSIGSLLEPDDTGKLDRPLPTPLYNDFTLIDPTGLVLAGPRSSARALQEGLNFGWQGVILKLTSQAPALWTGLYGISYRSLYGQALWTVAGLLGLILGAAAWGWSASRWQRQRAPAPGHPTHRDANESETFGRTVIETAPTGLCVVRREDFTVLLENPQARQGAGTKGLLSLLEQDPRHFDSGETCLVVAGCHLQVKFAATRYQGQDAVLCAFNDITRQVESSRALKQARHSAQRAGESQARLLATMSHKIRTPLYGVLGTLELLGLTPLASRQAGHLLTLQRCSTALLQLTSDILDVSRIESGKLAITSVEFSVLDMAEAALKDCAAIAEQRGLLLYACIDPHLPDLVSGDAGRIRQILDNLLGNAIKFTDSGQVVLRVRLLGYAGQRASIEWQVTDTGTGIPASQQEWLFDPDRSLPDTTSRFGAGLGLPLCQRLCTLMEGQLLVTSEPGLGSSFSLRLELSRLPGFLPGLQPLADGPPVHVRGPVPELVKNTCDWLNRLGIQALPAITTWDPQAQDQVLVDLLPRDTLRPRPGPRVSALPNPPRRQQHQDRQWIVDVHDIRAIAQAVAQARQGQSSPLQQPVDTRLYPLHLHVLVAEDNPINQALIQEQLHALGCRATLATNGEQALQHWQPQLFDLVLADLNMPVMNGYELARQLRQRDPQLPIIGITANALDEERNRCLAAGMSAWIVKPMNLQHLWQQLTQLCQVPAVPRSLAPPVTRERERQWQPGERLQLSPRMRPLFLETMKQDLLRLDQALERVDPQGAAERLHSIAGALGAVQASTLARSCAEMEYRLQEAPSSTSLEQEVRQLMQQLSELLLFIE